jgi:hypothetical protein
MGSVFKAGPMFLFFALLFSFHSIAQISLHEDSKWLRLLHYKKNIMGKYVSQADDKNFFLHPDGKDDPRAELHETIKLFSEHLNLNDDHPVCRFPLRYKWLNQKLGNPWRADIFKCKKYVSFFSKLAARRASIIFSSYYLSNPNSAFGHTLLRLSRFDDKNETEMLDYGINYSAKANESNPILYAFKGLMGGFEGRFAAIPYYYKIREYSDYEFRDLWSYDLKLTQQEILELVDHIWELGNTYFDYYYFLENCSYHLLSLIEVVRPKLELTNEYRIFAIPADTVRLLHKKGLISEGVKRDSTYSRLISFSKKLTNDELSTAKEIAKNPELTTHLIKDMNNNRAALVLDTSLEAFDYYNIERILMDHPEARNKKSQILLNRALNPMVTHQEKNYTDKWDSPALSHSPIRFSLGQNYTDDNRKNTKFEFRASLHDMLDPQKGSLKEAELELGKISIGLRDEKDNDSKLVLDNLTILSIKNYQNQHFWLSPISWDIGLGLKQLSEKNCFDCPGFFLVGSVGNSLHVLSEKILLALLITSELQLHSEFVNNYRLGLGPKIYSRFIFTDKWIGSLSSSYLLNSYQENKIFENQFWLSEFEIRHHFDQRLTFFGKLGAIKGFENKHSYGELGVHFFYD